MRVDIGPVPSTAALAWLDYAEGVLRELGDDARGVSVEARDAFAALITEWRSTASAGDTFRWSGNRDSGEVEYLVLALYRLGTRLSGEEETGRRERRPPEARRFHVVLVQSVLAALEHEGDAEAQFVAQLREVWEPAAEDS